MKPEVIIDGTWLSALMPWGDLEWSTCWPGGTESITFDVPRSHRLFRPDALVELDYGGTRLALGALVEPTRGEPLLAEGLHRKGEDYSAFDGAFEVTLNPNTAIDNAIARGMPWAPRTDTWAPSTVALDPDQPHSVSQVLDACVVEVGLQWGISPQTGAPFATGWHTTPTLHMLPGVDGLAISRDGYASTLYGRFLNVDTSLYDTAGAEDAAAVARWGRVERTVTETLGEGQPMNAVRAEEILSGMLAQGRSQMGWVSSLEVQHGDVVNQYLEPVDLNGVFARQAIRLHGLDEDLADLAGQTWVDAPIARTRHKGSSVTIEPRGLSQPMNDALADSA